MQLRALKIAFLQAAIPTQATLAVCEIMEHSETLSTRLITSPKYPTRTVSPLIMKGTSCLQADQPTTLFTPSVVCLILTGQKLENQSFLPNYLHTQNSAIPQEGKKRKFTRHQPLSVQLTTPRTLARKYFRLAHWQKILEVRFQNLRGQNRLFRPALGMKSKKKSVKQPVKVCM